MLMQPQQTPPTAPPANFDTSGQNPYSFIFEPPNKQKRRLIPSGNSTKERIIIIVGGLAGLLVIGLILVAVLGSSGENNKLELATISKEQTELIRIANIGRTKAQDTKVKNLAITTSQSLESSQITLKAVFKKNNINLTSKELAVSKNTATDTKLTNAEQANNFDVVFNQELTTELTTYRDSLKKAYDTTRGKTTRVALSTAYTGASTLLEAQTKTN